MANKEVKLGTPNPKQKAFFLARERFIAYGGARGGGKSWAVRMKAIAGALRYPGIQILICRHTYPELENTVIRPMVETLAQGGEEWAKYKAENRTVTFFNKSVIRFGHFSGGNAGEYQGQEYDWVFLDEATQFTEWEFRVLTATLRGVREIPRRMYLTCNPGGVGHSWVKRLFIDREFREKEKPEDYRFIPATVEDNKILLEKAPGYLDMLELLPEELRRGHRYGEWDTPSGQFFPEFSVKKHVVEKVVPEKSWRRFRAIDYGLDMFACVWVGVDPQGRCWVYREVQEPGLIVSQAAELMRRLTGEEEILLTAAPPDLWSTQKDSGRTLEELFARQGVALQKVVSSRVAGWMAVKEKLVEREDGLPGLMIERSCRGLIQNLQALRRSEKNPSDADIRPHSVTHICDALRYFCTLRVEKEEGEEDMEEGNGMLEYIYYGMEGGRW